jgi:hypothetical protein
MTVCPVWHTEVDRAAGGVSAVTTVLGRTLRVSANVRAVRSPRSWTAMWHRRPNPIELSTTPQRSSAAARMRRSLAQDNAQERVVVETAAIILHPEPAAGVSPAARGTAAERPRFPAIRNNPSPCVVSHRLASNRPLRLIQVRVQRFKSTEFRRLVARRGGFGEISRGRVYPTIGSTCTCASCGAELRSNGRRC